MLKNCLNNNPLSLILRFIMAGLYIITVFAIIYEAGTHEFSYGWYWHTDFSFKNLNKLGWVCSILSMTAIFFPWFYLGKRNATKGWKRLISPINILRFVNLFTIIPAVGLTLLLGFSDEDTKQGDSEAIMLIYCFFGIIWFGLDLVYIIVNHNSGNHE